MPRGVEKLGRISARAMKGRPSLKPSGSISRMAVCRLRLLRLTKEQIAEELDTEPKVIAAILLEPEVAEAIDRAEKSALEDTQNVLRAGALEAVQRLAQLVQSDDERIALAASNAWLTKAGADAPAKSEGKHEHTGKDGGIQIVVASADELRRLAAPKHPTEDSE